MLEIIINYDKKVNIKSININCFRTLMRLFPKAKVVLTVRDPEKWYDSVKNTIFQNVDLSQGTTGTFIKLIGMSKVHNMCIRLSQQGPPVTRYGKFKYQNTKINMTKN